MNNKNQIPKWLETLGIPALLIALASPILIYMAHFGFEISSDHTRWSEMGSAFSGIYTPVIALATLVVLAMQYNLQRRLSQKEEIQALIAERRTDFAGHLARIERLIDKHGGPQEALRATGISVFYGTSPEILQTEDHRQHAQALHIAAPQVLDAWTGIYMCFAGLPGSENEYLRQLYAKLFYSTIASISFPVASALDSYHFSARDTPTKFSYVFNEELNL